MIRAILAMRYLYHILFVRPRMCWCGSCIENRHRRHPHLRPSHYIFGISLAAILAALLLAASAWAQQPLARVQPLLYETQSDPPYKPVPCHNPKNHAADPFYQSVPPFMDNGPQWFPLDEPTRATYMELRKELEGKTDEVSRCEARGLTMALEAK